MIYLSQMLGKPVVDATGTTIGSINDIAIATGEVFPRVTSLAFRGPDKTPFMLSWRKFVEEFDGEHIQLNVPANEIRFSYLQPDEVLLHRDLLNKQIVDTQGMKVVRVNDLKLSESRSQLRLLGAEVGVRGLLRGISPRLEAAARRIARAFGGNLNENLIAWNYMDLLDRDLSQVKLSVTHKRLHELHPADVADILEQLAPNQRARVFEHLDNEQAADAISELDDELQADLIDDLSERRASALLAEMDPDDAADIIGDLPYDKAEKLLRLMGVAESSVIRGLLGYKEKTAGGIMTPEIATATEGMTVGEVLDKLRAEASENEYIYYIYVVQAGKHLVGAISLRDLLLSDPSTPVSEIAERDLFTAHVDDDQETVAEYMSKYNLMALPVIDESGRLLGAVTVDDALDVLEEEANEDIAIATGTADGRGQARGLAWWFLRRSWWLAIWALAAVSVVELASRMPAALTSASLVIPAIVLLPIVLRVAEDSAQRAIAIIIDEPEAANRPSIASQLLTEAAFGLLLGLVAGLLVFAVGEFVLRQAAASMTLAVVVGLSVWFVQMLSVGVIEYSRRRMEADKRVSGSTVSVTMMLLSSVLFLALAAAGSAVFSAVGGA
ncbi:MAG: magnesium transporter [Coriobacteriia bacterium]